MMPGRRWRRLLVVVLVPVLIGACGLGATAEVQIGEGDGPDGAWTAVVRPFDNGLIRDGRVCVQFRFEDRDPTNTGCGWNAEGRNGMEIEADGSIIAQTWNPAATQARFEPVDGLPVVVPVVSGEPVSHARWIALRIDPVGFEAGAPSFEIVFLDTAGNEVDAIR